MSIRYIANGNFTCFGPKGQRLNYAANHVAKGKPGYESLPDWLSDEQRASFTVLEIDDGVEQATAAPGEKRTRKRKPKAQTVGVEAVAEVDTVHDA